MGWDGLGLAKSESPMVAQAQTSRIASTTGLVVEVVELAVVNAPHSINQLWLPGLVVCVMDFALRKVSDVFMPLGYPLGGSVATSSLAESCPGRFGDSEAVDASA